MLLINIRSLLKNSAELQAGLRLMDQKPDIVFINETWLDKSIVEVPLEGYVCVARLDRRSGQKCGGVATYAREAIAPQIALMQDSPDAERQWLILHTNQGPFLLANWYRPPCAGEVDTIKSLQSEWQALKAMAMGTVVVGDLNVHHKSWLRFSQRESVEGRELYSAAQDCSLCQLVRSPTRGENLLDLVLSDIEAKCEVMPKIADHNAVLIKVGLSVPEVKHHSRVVWHFCKADWEGLQNELDETDWSILNTASANDGAELLQARILEAAEEWIPRKKKTVKSSSHEWLTDEVVRLVQAKRDAEGTPHELEAAQTCSAEITAEFARFVEKSKQELQELPRGSKGWWRKVRAFALKGRGVSGIASLRDGAVWKHSAVDKAELFATVFQSKCIVPCLEVNEYSEVAATAADSRQFGLVEETLALQVLSEIRSDSATGPDLLPARILKECARQLARPISMLARRIIATSTWPEAWRVHWIVPIHKRAAVTNAGNYRGVHLTAQISKAVERMIGKLSAPFIQAPLRIGLNQFAYCKEKGARDALAYLVLSCIVAFEHKKKVIMFCSDVQGAFDKVSEVRFAEKIRKSGLPDDLIPLFESWMKSRKANVLTDGSQSASMVLSDMVYQGTVWGPSLWNVFFGDAERPIHKSGFTPVVYADDLNAIKEIDSTMDNAEALAEGRSCQSELHRWGRANGVTFDPGKESMHILSRTDPLGEAFKILGVSFDVKLIMEEAVLKLAAEAGWRIRTILRAQRFHTVAELVHLYKSQVLSYLEYRTVAIYHSCDTHLAHLDRVQNGFLRKIGITAEQALLEFNLAPLSTRRDMAMLGMIHRSVIGKGPSQLQAFFKPVELPRRSTRASARMHSRQLKEFRTGQFSALIARSALGLVSVYNLLPQAIVDASSVKEFQCCLQSVVKNKASSDAERWEFFFSPRICMYSHPVRSL